MARTQLFFSPKKLLLLVLVIACFNSCFAHNKPSNSKDKAVVAISSCINVCASTQTLVSKLLRLHGLTTPEISLLKGCQSALISVEGILKKSLKLVVSVDKSDPTTWFGGNSIQIGANLKVSIEKALSLTNSCQIHKANFNTKVVRILHEQSLKLEGSVQQALGLALNCVAPQLPLPIQN